MGEGSMKKKIKIWEEGLAKNSHSTPFRISNGIALILQLAMKYICVGNRK